MVITSDREGGVEYCGLRKVTPDADKSLIYLALVFVHFQTRDKEVLRMSIASDKELMKDCKVKGGHSLTSLFLSCSILGILVNEKH